jgi:hypothetical protein
MFRSTHEKVLKENAETEATRRDNTKRICQLSLNNQEDRHEDQVNDQIRYSKSLERSLSILGKFSILKDGVKLRELIGDDDYETVIELIKAPIPEVINDHVEFVDEEVTTDTVTIPSIELVDGNNIESNRELILNATVPSVKENGQTFVQKPNETEKEFQKRFAGKEITPTDSVNKILAEVGKG